MKYEIWNQKPEIDAPLFMHILCQLSLFPFPLASGFIFFFLSNLLFLSFSFFSQLFIWPSFMVCGLCELSWADLDLDRIVLEGAQHISNRIELWVKNNKHENTKIEFGMKNNEHKNTKIWVRSWLVKILVLRICVLGLMSCLIPPSFFYTLSLHYSRY